MSPERGKLKSFILPTGNQTRNYHVDSHIQCRCATTASSVYLSKYSYTSILIVKGNFSEAISINLKIGVLIVKSF